MTNSTLCRIPELRERLSSQHLNIAARGESTKLYSDIALGSSGFLTLISFMTPVGPVAPAMLLGASVLYKMATAGTINIPFRSTTFGGLMNRSKFSQAVASGAISPLSQLRLPSVTALTSLPTLKEKVAYLLTGPWIDLVLPYMALRTTEEAQIEEFNKVLLILANSQPIERFIVSPADVDCSPHGSYGVGLKAFFKWCGDIIDRGYVDSIETAIPTVIEFENPISIPSATSSPDTIDAVIVASSSSLESPQRSIAECLGGNLQSALIVGFQRSGKGFAVAHGARLAMERNPRLKVYFVDPKANPDENYLNGVIPSNQIFAVRMPSSLEMRKNPDALNEWLDALWDFIGPLEDQPDTLLIVDELSKLKKSLSKVEFDKLTGLLHTMTTLGPATRTYSWSMTQSPMIEDLGLTSGSLQTYKRVAIVKAKGDQASVSLLTSEARGFFGTQQNQSVIGSRMFWDSEVNGWSVSSELPPLDKPSSPTAAVTVEGAPSVTFSDDEKSYILSQLTNFPKKASILRKNAARDGFSIDANKVREIVSVLVIEGKALDENGKYRTA